MAPTLAKIPPAAPTLAKIPPAGRDWIPEVKFDGWCVKIHTNGDGYTLYSKKGVDYTRRFRSLAPIMRALPAKDAIIDCELVACDKRGRACFKTLIELGNKATLCLVPFDILHLNGVRLMPVGIEQRKAILETLVAKTGSKQFQFSRAFNDPNLLLADCYDQKLKASFRSGVVLPIGRDQRTSG